MATRSRDVQLVVRAKDEASKAFEAAADALENLLGVNDKVGASAGKTGDRLTELAALAANLDKAYSKISGAADQAQASFDRQTRAIDEQKNRLAALETQARAAAAVIGTLQSSAQSQKDFIGPPTRDLVNLKAFTAEYDRLQAEIGKVTSTINAQEAALNSQRSAMQQIGSTAIAAADAQERLQKEINTQTAALQKQTTAAEQNARVLANLRTVTGLDRAEGQPLNEDMAGLHAQIEAHNALIAKLKAEQAAENELNTARERGQRLVESATAPLSGKSARESAAVFAEADAEAAKASEKATRDAARAADEEAAAVTRLKAALNPMAAIQDHLNQELREAKKLFDAGKISAAEYNGAIKLLNANAKQAGDRINNGKPSLFGLSPYQAQNFSFQINDLVTQIASGTSVAQAFAQQGGQILQIFPKAGAAIIAAFSNPVILGAAALLGGIALGLKEIGDESERLRTFQGLVTATAGASQDQAAALAESAKQIDRYGLSAKDAVAVTQTLFRDGINPARITEFGLAAKDMADVLGVDVKDAAKQLADAFTGDYDAIRKLDQSLDFLTAAQRDHIKVLFDEGKAEQARVEAFRIFSKEYDEAAVKMRGPWTDAVRSLGNAWKDFMGLLADRQIIKDTSFALDYLGLSISKVINRMRGIRDIAAVTGELELAQKTLKQLQEQGGPDIFGIGKARIENLKKEVIELEAELEKLRKAQDGGSQADTRSDNTERSKKATEDLQVKLDELAKKDKTLSDAQRIAGAEAEARQQALNDLKEEGLRWATEEVKQQYIAQKVALARADTEKKIADEKKAQATSEEQAIRGFSQRVVGAEGGSAKNPFSSAQGFGQFIDSTWLDQFKKVFGEAAKGMTQDQILALRQNKEVASAIIDNYARENANFLKKIGAQITEGNLYLAHFLGAGDAKKVLQAPPDTPVDTLLSAGVMNANKSYLRKKDGSARTASELIAFIDKRIGGSSSAQSSGAKELSDLEDQATKRQSKLNETIEQGNKSRKATTDELTKQSTLMDQALLDEQAKAAGDKAVLDLQKAVDLQNANLKPYEKKLELTQAQIDATRKAAEEEVRAQQIQQRAQANATAVDRPVDTLEQDKANKEQEIALAQQRGGDVTVLQQQLTDIKLKLDEARNAQIAFWESVVAGGEAAAAVYGKTVAQIQAMIDAQKNAKTSNKDLTTQFIATGKQFNEMFADGVASAFDRFAQSVANGENAVDALKNAFLQFASDFLRQIAQMIIKQAVFNLIGGAGGGGGLGGIISGAIGGIFHEGGVVGEPGPTRAVNPAWFTNAMRYHDGGIAGLKPGEVPAILKRGEVVDPGDGSVAGPMFGGGGQQQGGIKVVNVFNPADVLQHALGDKAGEKVMLNWVRANPSAFKAALG